MTGPYWNIRRQDRHHNVAAPSFAASASCSKAAPRLEALSSTRSAPTPTTKRHAQDVYLGSAPTAIANNSFYEQSLGAMKNAMTSHPMCTPWRRLRHCCDLCRLGSLGALRAANIVKHLLEELRVYAQVAALAVRGAARGDLLAVLGVSLHGQLVQLRQMVEGNVRVRMMFHMPRHLPRELAVEPPSGRRSRAHPSVRVGVAAHQTGTVLGELIHAQVPGTEAVREQPIEDKWHAEGFLIG
mmetsp:Transcript_147083/g.472426  ORF Transcript_147083/g.472426 Transcript_147083/m.472426 type:complete len:241 (+) Transcript_147083:62-784(+)